VNDNHCSDIIGKVKIKFAASKKKGKVYLKQYYLEGIKIEQEVLYSDSGLFSGKKGSYGKWSKAKVVKIR